MISLEHASEGHRISVVEVYYFGEDIDSETESAAKLQISHWSADSIDASVFKTDATETLLAGSTPAYLQTGEGLIRVTFEVDGLIISVLADDATYSISDVLGIADTLEPFGL